MSRESDLMLDVSLAHELKLAGRRAGALDKDFKVMSEGNMLQRLLPIIRGHATIQFPTQEVDRFGYKKGIPEDSYVLCDISANNKKNAILSRVNEDLFADGKKISLFLTPDQVPNHPMSGLEIREVVQNQPTLSASYLEHLADNPFMIPDSWIESENGFINQIYFWGTTYQHRTKDERYIRYMYFSHGKWVKRYTWIGNSNWHSHAPAAVHEN